MSDEAAGAITMVVVILAVIGALVYGVFNFIWWRECVDAGGVYINGQNVWPSCFGGSK